MKTSIYILVFWLSLGTICAQQKIEKHIDFTGKESVSLRIEIADSINIHTWNKKEMFITGSININDNKDNDAYTTKFEETGTNIVVEANFKKNYFKGNNNCCNQSRIFWEVFIPENTPLNVESINANINIDGKTEKMKVKSISGYIDLSVPAVRDAELEFSTISGTIYSNHELALNKKKGGIPTVITQKMNNGGSPIKLETISGDIFFRKSN